MPLAVFTSAFLTLAVEVFYARLFAALFWKNTAFAILSLAMLGIGASGVLVYLRPSWFPSERAPRQVAWFTATFGLSIVGSYVVILAMSRIAHSEVEPLSNLVALISVGIVPFFFGGLILSIAFTHSAAGIARLYRIDLVAASLGAVFVLPALRALNGPLLVPVLGLGATVAAVVLARRARDRVATWAAAALSFGLLALMVLHIERGVLRVTHAHGQEEGPIEIERWDPLARITVRPYGPLSKWIDIDSQVVTAVLRYDGNAEAVSYLRRSVLQLAYHVRQYPKVLIIGPGGGSDVLSALTFGNRDITAVEVNRTTIQLMRTELRDYTGGLYDQPSVKIRVADGRAYVAAMKDKVDLIQATFVDTFTTSASGAHTLSENYLYTVDGFGDFLDHLNPGGILSMSRWGGEAFSFAETHRAAALARSALEARGASVPGDHVVVVQGAPPERLTLGGGYMHQGGFSESMSTLLVKTAPFTNAELDGIHAVVTDAGFRTLWLGARGGGDATLHELFRATEKTGVFRRYLERTGLDVSPVTDDRPFFFDMIDPIGSLVRPVNPEWAAHVYYGARYVGVSVLHQLLAATSLLACALLVIPLLGRLRDLKRVRRPVPTLGYFVCLGIGFIGIELALMQRFALFLEHPVYSLVVFLASVLLFSGLGSASTASLERDFAKAAAKRGGLLVLVLAVYGLAVPLVVRALIGLPLVLKMAVAVLLAFPPAYLMGMMFPLGVGAIRGEHERLVPWVWGLNSAFSVVGAVASLFLAMSFGYTVTWFIFTAAYGLAALSMLRLARA